MPPPHPRLIFLLIILQTRVPSTYIKLCILTVHNKIAKPIVKSLLLELVFVISYNLNITFERFKFIDKLMFS